MKLNMSNNYNTKIVSLVFVLNVFVSLPAYGETEMPASQATNEKPVISTKGKNPGMQEPAIKQLDAQRYQVGSIIVDKIKKQFQITGKMLKGEPPLEYLLIVKDGPKAYESLVELNANAFEFNLACILIGLQNKTEKPLQRHFDQTPVVGSPLEIAISWKDGKKQYRYKAGELLLNDGKATVVGDWVYAGSSFSPDGFYMADVDGVLAGFVHSPASIIEHRTGLGLGNYGAVGANPKLMPALNSVVTVTISTKLADVKGTNQGKQVPSPAPYEELP